MPDVEETVLFPMSEKDRKVLLAAMKTLRGGESAKLAHEFSAERLASYRELTARIESAV